MPEEMPKDPAAINKMMGGPVGVWMDQGSIMIKAVMPNGGPVKLTSQEAKNLAQMLQTFAVQA